MKRRLLLSCCALALTFIGSMCDLRADECDEGQNYCTSDNVAVFCRREVPEAHRQIERQECGPSATCTIDEHDLPFCAGQPLAPCEHAQATACEGNVLSTCVATKSGANVWSDQGCGQSTCTPRDGGAYCRWQP